MINTAQLERKVEELAHEGHHFTLVTVVRAESPTSAKPGAKALVTFDGDIYGWIGGGCAQPAVIKTVRECIKSGQPQLIRVTPSVESALEDGIVKFNMACHSGGTLDIFIEPITVKPILLIIGASPVAQALSSLAAASGFEVTVAAEGIDRTGFSDNIDVLDNFTALDGHFNRMPYVVVSTQGKRDNAGLKAALAIASPYTSLVASTRKAAKLLEGAAQSGIDKSVIDKVRYPAGIEIGAISPEEIAVSLLAELIQVKNKAGEDMYTPPQRLSDKADADLTKEKDNLSTTATPVGSCCAKK